MIFGGVRIGGRKLTDDGSMAGSPDASMSRKRTPPAPSRITSATSLAGPANGTRPCSVSAPTCCLPLLAKVASFISVSLVVSVGDGASGSRVAPLAVTIPVDEVQRKPSICELRVRQCRTQGHEQMWLCHFAHTPSGGG